MSHELFTVKHSFVLDGRGLVLVTEPAIDSSVLDAGDPLVVKRADGSELAATVNSIEILSGRDESNQPTSTYAIVLPRRFTRDDVPVGCSVWSASN